MRIRTFTCKPCPRILPPNNGRWIDAIAPSRLTGPRLHWMDVCFAAEQSAHCCETMAAFRRQATIWVRKFSPWHYRALGPGRSCCAWCGPGPWVPRPSQWPLFPRQPAAAGPLGVFRGSAPLDWGPRPVQGRPWPDPRRPWTGAAGVGGSTGSSRTTGCRALFQTGDNLTMNFDPVTAAPASCQSCFPSRFDCHQRGRRGTRPGRDNFQGAGLRRLDRTKEGQAPVWVAPAGHRRGSSVSRSAPVAGRAIPRPPTQGPTAPQPRLRRGTRSVQLFRAALRLALRCAST